VALPAFAHVTVNPSQAEQGSYAELAFRVPNETDNASTTKLQVFFPTSEPLGSVLVKPLPGWSSQVKTTKLKKPVQTDDGPVTEAVSQVVWTADSAATAIKPGQFEDFQVSAGPLPSRPSMVFKALQTYSNGEVVRWIQTPTAGGGEPEHPAPVLKLLPASSTATGNQSMSDGSSAAAQAAGSGTRVNAALGVGIAALVVATLGIGLALRRHR